MLVSVHEAAVVGVLMRMKRMHVSIALLDATELPDHHRDSPGSEKRADNHIAQDPEVESGNEVEESSLEIKHADQYLKQLDRSDDQCHGNRQAGNDDIVKNLPQRIDEGPVVRLRHQHAVGGVHCRYARG